MGGKKNIKHGNMLIDFLYALATSHGNIIEENDLIATNEKQKGDIVWNHLSSCDCYRPPPSFVFDYQMAKTVIAILGQEENMERGNKIMGKHVLCSAF
jgi:hypothetical protein